MTWQILLPAEIDPAGPDSIADIAEFTSTDDYDDRAALLADADRFDAVVVRSFDVDEALLDRASDLKVISKHGAGLDTVDVAAATERGVLVCNTPGANASAVAEHAIALALAVRRRLRVADAHVRGGEWDRAAFQSSELRGDTLGLYGVGNVGRRTADFAAAFGMDVVAHDPYVDPETLPDVDLVEPAALFDRADVLSVHAPLTDETRGAIGAAELERLPEGAIVVNTARGGIVDEDALAAALKSGPVVGAGLDTFSTEPPDTTHPLFDHEGVLCSPHVAGVTDESKREMSRRAAANVRTVYEGNVPESTVNPEAVDR